MFARPFVWSALALISYVLMFVSIFNFLGSPATVLNGAGVLVMWLVTLGLLFKADRECKRKGK